MAKTIPNKDVDFNAKQEVITKKTETNLQIWGINYQWYVGQLAPAKAAWQTAWAAYQNKATRTPLITFAKNKAREAYEPLLGLLVEMLKSNPLVTPADREEIGIAEGKPGGHNPPPDTYPGYHIDSSLIRCLIVYFYVLGSKSKAKPHGVHGAEIRWALLDAAPTDVSQLVHSSFDTHSPFKLEFNESDRGKTIWFCLRWENTTGEK
ncbi:MAG: hypothetical protein LBC40_05800, partial [Dysgonamonadaceae bacterium]|nr:hypothetical protein [Dysgonamonadaceae bacterium]